MPIASLILLLLLPSAEWLIWSAFRPSIRRTVVQQEIVSPLILKESFTRIFLFIGRANLLIYLVVLFGTGAWLWFNHLTWQQVGVKAVFEFGGVVLGTGCGVAFFGTLILLSAFQNRLIPRRQLLWEVPALYALGETRWLLLLVGAGAFELWRASTVTSLINDSLSSGMALLLCTGVYALRLASRGPYRVAYAAIEGLSFGGLFLWTGSLVAPVAARLACEFCMCLIFRGAVPGPPDFSLPPIASCPLCGRGLSREEVRFRTSFTCPQCQQVIGSPSWRMPVVKFTCFAGLVAFLGLFLEFTPERSADSFFYFCIAYIGAFLATIGSVVLIDAWSLRKLSPGSPGIPSMGLTSSNRDPHDQDCAPPE